jgi:hypothetical protein
MGSALGLPSPKPVVTYQIRFAEPSHIVRS